MALLGLDDIEWDKLSHSYGSAEDIPDLLRALDMTEPNEEFDRIFDDLMSRINRNNDIYDSTAPTIDFLLQILRKLTDSETQRKILYPLGNLLQDIQNYPVSYFKDPGDCRVVLFRNNIATYDAVARGLEFYLAGIIDENPTIRLANLRVLFALNEQREEILSNLSQSIDKVNDEWFQACIVWTYAYIARYDKYGRERVHYDKQLNNWLEHKNALVRYAAAFGKLLHQIHPKQRSALTIKIIAEALGADVLRSKQNELGDSLAFYLDLTPFRNPIKIISTSWPSPELWISILQQLEPNPQQVHICVAEILKLSFSTKNVATSWPNWTDLHFHESVGNKFIYQEAYSVFSYISGKPLHEEKQRLALQTIVDCEPFWEIPTNLFSFFYGLPDAREELRKLAEGK